jgi:hypothetical protein
MHLQNYMRRTLKKRGEGRKDPTPVRVKISSFSPGRLAGVFFLKSSSRWLINRNF